jgi:hypothetical protein
MVGPFEEVRSEAFVQTANQPQESPAMADQNPFKSLQWPISGCS